MRKQIANLKAQQSQSTLKDLSNNILAFLETQAVFKEASVILLYYSLPDEVNTHQFIEKWKDIKTIILPVVIGDELELRYYTGIEDLAIGRYGIKEPIGKAFNNLKTIDLAIIPGVAFDREGNRLGRGKGYYDRLLPQIDAYKIGICFPFQLIDYIPTEPFDVRMNQIIV